MATTDDVFNLLDAVNKVTLKRMENQERVIDSITRSIHERLDVIEDKLGIPRTVINSRLPQPPPPG